MSPSICTSSRSNLSLRSFSRARGTISLSVNSRAVSWMRRCSSVRSKSIKGPPETRKGFVTLQRRRGSRRKAKGRAGGTVCAGRPLGAVHRLRRATTAEVGPNSGIRCALAHDGGRVMKARCLTAALAAAVLLIPAVARAAAPAPTFIHSKIVGAQQVYPWSEPRIATGPDGTLWATTNDASSAAGIVFFSKDGGHTWTRTPTDPPLQINPSPDVDIVVTPTGRVIATELDESALNFPTAYTDDGGKTWNQSVGGNMLADQDRQWLAVGAKDPQSGQYKVYLLFYNLASGNATHNMFVSTSTDNGATFGPPIPITSPPEDAWKDLQCADSGGPSTIFVNQRTGTVYAEFTTRATPTQGGDLGGCATPAAGQPLEFNIVAGTRVWISQSNDGGQTWKNSLAVDDSPTSQIVSMQVAYAGLDTAGNIYVLYPESKGAYPDYSGGGVKYKFAAPNSDATKLQWSGGQTLAQPSGPGHVLVHLAIGEPGQIQAAYWSGFDGGPGGKPVWYMTSATVLNAFDSQPSVTENRMSNVPADIGTASELMGACVQAGPISGIMNGIACGRSRGVWGVAVSRSCMPMWVWRAVDATASGNDPGTWVSTQTGGASLCSPPAVTQQAVTSPGGKAGARGSCPDRTPPITRLSKRGRRLRIRGGSVKLGLGGTTRDSGCKTANLIAARTGVKVVNVSVQKVRGGGHGKNCRFVKKNGTLTAWQSCRKPVLLPARGKSRWSFRKTYRLPAGRYRAVARGIDLSGNRELPAKRRNIVKFTIR